MRKILYIILSICLLAGAASAQGGRYDNIVVGPRGPVAAAYVAVCGEPANVNVTPCSTLATLYTDATLSTPCTGTLVVAPSSPSQPCSNPMLSDALGNYHFYAAQSSTFTVQIYGPQVNPPFPMYDQTVPLSSPLNGVTCKSFESILCADGFSGSDIGAKINAAYAACPTNGSDGACIIAVPVQSNAACYNYSTPIVLNTSNKSVTLEGWGTSSATGGVCLNYTPTTATKAITMDYTPNTGPGFARAGGIRDITIENNGCVTPGGCSSSATGIVFGGTNSGAAFAHFTDVRVMGFGTAVSWLTTNSFGQVWDSFSIDDNTTGLSGGSVATLENMAFHGGFIASNMTGASLNLGSAGGDWVFEAVSFDDNQTVGVTAQNGHISFQNCHFENAQGGTTHYVQGIDFVNYSFLGGSFADDVSTSTTDWWIKTSGYGLDVEGAEIQSAGRTVTEVVEADTPVRAYLRFSNFSPSTGTGTIFGGTSASQVTNESYDYGVSVRGAQPNIFEGKLIAPNAAILANLTTTAATSDNATVTGMTSSGHCALTATNASAATNIATTYVSAKTTNQITVTHVATSGMTYDVSCTPN